jgi:prepilin-type N-terminal cleavage/methylation domain-containing protein
MRNRGFTLIEVLAMTLILGVGLMALMGVTMYAMSKQLDAQAACSAMPTAISVASDPRPLLPPETAGDWVVDTVDPRGAGAATATTKGWMNGYWVERVESSMPDDVLGEWRPSASGWSITPGGARSVRVTVRVFESGSAGAKEVAYFVTRLVKQAP